MNSNFDLQDYALEVVGSNASILELGSGEGTIRLTELFNKVTTIENDKKWLNKSNARYIYAPLEAYTDKYFREATHWYSTSALKDQLLLDYDLIIVDGPKGSYGRGGFFTYFNLFKHNVPILFDDVHRLWDFRLMGKVAKELNVNATVITKNRWFGFVDPR